MTSSTKYRVSMWIQPSGSVRVLSWTRIIDESSPVICPSCTRFHLNTTRLDPVSRRVLVRHSGDLWVLLIIRCSSATPGHVAFLAAIGDNRVLRKKCGNEALPTSSSRPQSAFLHRNIYYPQAWFLESLARILQKRIMLNRGTECYFLFPLSVNVKDCHKG